jgi:capsular exopolysaccharide synthesis family protein
MSRVDEARRRASGHPIDNQGYSEATGVASRDDQLLEDYPRERGSNSPEHSSRVQRSISAPRSAAAGHLGSLDPALNGKLLGSPDTPPVVIEQYRRLAASLHELQVDTGLKTLLVTSAMPREGKTLTVTNIALTLSHTYRRRVLLIDADLRRPSLHEVFRLPRTIGLSEALRSGSRPHLLELSPMLSILPAGELNGDPLTALTSDRLPALLAQCVAAFDWVLFDAPPVGLMPDGNVLARLTKAVVFVIGARTTPYHVIERAIAEVGRDFIVGTVLNRIDEQDMSIAKGYEHYAYPPQTSGTTGS